MQMVEGNDSKVGVSQRRCVASHCIALVRRRKLDLQVRGRVLCDLLKVEHVARIVADKLQIYRIRTRTSQAVTRVRPERKIRGAK